VRIASRASTLGRIFGGAPSRVLLGAGLTAETAAEGDRDGEQRKCSPSGTEPGRAEDAGRVPPVHESQTALSGARAPVTDCTFTLASEPSIVRIITI
jgi:hypothetical protein